VQSSRSRALRKRGSGGQEDVGIVVRSSRSGRSGDSRTTSSSSCDKACSFISHPFTWAETVSRLYRSTGPRRKSSMLVHRSSVMLTGVPRLVLKVSHRRIARKKEGIMRRAYLLASLVGVALLAAGFCAVKPSSAEEGKKTARTEERAKESGKSPTAALLP